jgi:hypothetical protein
MNRFSLAVVAVMTCAFQTAAAASLSPADTNLGRVKAPVLKDGLTISVDLNGDVPSATHVLVRFQNNQPLMLGRDGLWALWNGDPTRLDEAGAVVADKKIVFRIFDKLPDAFFYPVSFTVMYRAGDVLKSGTITLDEP